MGEKIPVIKRKPMIILVEGIDCSGKGFLINALGKAYPGIVIKNTRRPASGTALEVMEYKRHLSAIMELINHNRQSKTVILDRFFPSEMVYSLVKRGYEAWDEQYYEQLERSIACMPHLYIWCNPDKKVILERLLSRGDDYINKSDINALMDRYAVFFQDTKMNKVNLDTSKSADEMLNIISNKLDSYDI